MLQSAPTGATPGSSTAKAISSTYFSLPDTANFHFILVHGAYHGAWCWELLKPELERADCAVTAVDLPCEDPDAGGDRYADIAAAAVGEPSGDLVAVGHSLGGLTVPLLARRLPLRKMVFLCALLPRPGTSLDRQHLDFDTGFVPSEQPHANADGSASWPERGAIETYYHDCPPDVARSAARRLRRQHWRITQEVTPLQAWPPLPSAYVLTREDRAVSPSFCRQLAQERLGVAALELPGGHSPFLARPAELANLLLSLAGSSVS